MTGDNISRLRGYFSELKKLIDNQSYAKVIRTSNKILNECDTNEKAWLCKLTAFIHLGQFSEALEALKKCKILNSLSFEKAYCEYRTNDVQAAWKTINGAADSAKAKELKAQILYRIERYDECYAVYRDLTKNVSDQYDQERLTNLYAVSVNRSFEKGEKMIEIGSDASYEQIYNKGCHLLARGKKEEALKCLKDAESCCQKLLQLEGASEDEILDEIPIIKIQQGYVLQLLNREREATAIYNSVLKTKPDDSALIAIINNNLIAINRDANVFDSKKRIKATFAAGLEHKLTSSQRNSFTLNHCLLAYYTNQDDVCESEIEKLIKLNPQRSFAAVLIKACLYARRGKEKVALDVLEKYAKENPKNSCVSLLSAAQILLSQGNMEGAIDVLWSLDECNRLQNGVVSAIVTLCSAIGKIQKASELLQEAVEWHKKREVSDEKLYGLWHYAADFHIRNGEIEVAASSLEELQKLDPSNMSALAQLISVYSQFDRNKAQELSKLLPDARCLIKDLDAESLEASFVQKYQKKSTVLKTPSPYSSASPTSGKSIGTSNKKTQIRKKRKTRLPKNYVEGSKPDPERWLPRWQRQGYKKKRDRRNKDVGKGTQGVSSDVADKFDITKTAGQHHTSVPQYDIMRPHQKKKGGKKKK